MTIEYGHDPLCHAVEVGPRKEEALQCFEMESVSRPKPPGSDEPPTKNLFSVAIHVVRDKHFVTLLNAPVKSDVMDPIVRPPGQPAPPFHPFVLAKDGMSVSVTGDDAECHRKRPEAKTAWDRAWNSLDAELQKRICVARGRYVWRNGRFTSAS